MRCCGTSRPTASSPPGRSCMAEPPMKIALLTHSVNPRGGVVHAMELGQALQSRGHAVTLLAPAAPGQRLFRDTPCRVELADAPPASADLADTVRSRIVALRDHLAALLRNESFDVLHAHEGIGGNALADLRASGRIGGHVRTVHHLDRFADERVQAWEERAIRDARHVLSVSAAGRDRLRHALGIESSVVANGVDLARYTPRPCRGDAELARRLGVGAGGPVVLLVGGIEARKNTRRLLAALRLARGRHAEPPAVCRRHSWAASAECHEALYRLPVADPKGIAMPAMHYRLRWPDASESDCYSPSLVIKDYFAPGDAVPLDEFLVRLREATRIASDRVAAKYGYACSRALEQLAVVEARAE